MKKATFCQGLAMPGIGHLERFKIFTAISFLFLFPAANFPQSHPIKVVDSILISGIDNIINQNYSQAELNFQKLNGDYAEIPLGKIYLAAAEIARSYDYADKFNSELIREYLSEAIEQSEQLVKQDEHALWNNYYLALAKGYQAYFKALEGDWLAAIAGGFSSISLFEKCLQIDSSFYEAYAAIGTYKYWKSRRTEFLHWLPFIDDESEAGINYLETSSNINSYNTHLAVHSLQWIYIDKKDFDSAIKLSEAVIARYPESRIFKWGYVRALEEVDKKKAIFIYHEILKSYPRNISSYKYNEILLKHLIAQQHEKLGEYKPALELCNEILSITELTEDNKKKLGDRLERVRHLRDGLIKKKID
jgi:hypothetical protein